MKVESSETIRRDCCSSETEQWYDIVQSPERSGVLGTMPKVAKVTRVHKGMRAALVKSGCMLEHLLNLKLLWYNASIGYAK